MTFRALLRFSILNRSIERFLTFLELTLEFIPWLSEYLLIPLQAL